MKDLLKFKQLWVGDRFLCHGSLWTKISLDTARLHSSEGIALKELSYNYIGDTVCSFELEDEIEFVFVS